MSKDEGSFIVATTGNLMVDLGWRVKLAITAEINNRAVELFFCVKSHPKNARVLISNSDSLHESNRAN